MSASIYRQGFVTNPNLVFNARVKKQELPVEPVHTLGYGLPANRRPAVSAEEYLSTLKPEQSEMIAASSFPSVRTATSLGKASQPKSNAGTVVPKGKAVSKKQTGTTTPSTLPTDGMPTYLTNQGLVDPSELIRNDLLRQQRLADATRQYEVPALPTYLEPTKPIGPVDISQYAPKGLTGALESFGEGLVAVDPTNPIARAFQAGGQGLRQRRLEDTNLALQGLSLQRQYGNDMNSYNAAMNAIAQQNYANQAALREANIQASTYDIPSLDALSKAGKLGGENVKALAYKQRMGRPTTDQTVGNLLRLRGQHASELYHLQTQLAKAQQMGVDEASLTSLGNQIAKKQSILSQLDAQLHYLPQDLPEPDVLSGDDEETKVLRDAVMKELGK